MKMKWFLPHGCNPVFLLKFSSGCLPIWQERGNTINTGSILQRNDHKAANHGRITQKKDIITSIYAQLNIESWKLCKRPLWPDFQMWLQIFMNSQNQFKFMKNITLSWIGFIWDPITWMFLNTCLS